MGLNHLWPQNCDGEERLCFEKRAPECHVPEFWHPRKFVLLDWVQNAQSPRHLITTVKREESLATVPRGSRPCHHPRGAGFRFKSRGVRQATTQSSARLCLCLVRFLPGFSTNSSACSSNFSFFWLKHFSLQNWQLSFPAQTLQSITESLVSCTNLCGAFLWAPGFQLESLDKSLTLFCFGFCE